METAAIETQRSLPWQPSLAAACRALGSVFLLVPTRSVNFPCRYASIVGMWLGENLLLGPQMPI